jgi:peroxiredoxin
MKPFPLLILLSSWLTLAAQATPASAALTEKEYLAAMEKWSLEIRLANTPEARAATIQKRPDPYAFAKRMWTAIGPSLKEDWTIEPAAWFLNLTSRLAAQNPDGTTVPAFADEANKIRQAVETYHLSSSKLSPICLALTASADPRALPLLEKIESTNPDQKVQGTAALGVAMILKTLGDSPELMKKRLTALRKAIIQSADVEIDGTSVSKLAEDELYIIRYLTKGRVAPDLQGVDSAGKRLSLAEQQGKIIVLLFWNSSLPEAARVLQLSSAMEEKFRGKPFVLIGVNNDPLEKLRSLQADGSVKWPNFSDPENKLSTEYRVGSWPLAYVLDGERKVHYAGAPGSFVELTAEALLQQQK